jgi:hypothetical protein
MPPPSRLGSSFDEAVQYALLVHGGSLRKGRSIPYVSHLLADVVGLEARW